MIREDILKRLESDVINFNIDGIKESARIAVEAGISSEEVINGPLSRGLKFVDKKYQEDEFFLPDLVMAGEAMTEAVKVLFGQSNAKGGKDVDVVLATVEGDIHDIGKNIFSSLLRGSGVSVVDLGVDVSMEEIIDSVEHNRPRVLGLSTMITTSRGRFKEVLRGLEEKGLRKNIKIIIGGAATGRVYAKIVGADAYAEDAFKGLKIVSRWI